MSLSKEDKKSIAAFIRSEIVDRIQEQKTQPEQLVDCLKDLFDSQQIMSLNYLGQRVSNVVEEISALRTELANLKDDLSKNDYENKFGALEAKIKSIESEMIQTRKEVNEKK